MPLCPKVFSLLAASAIIVLSTQLTSAAEMKRFDQASFEAAQAHDRPIVVDIAATWCPTCAAQKPIIESLAADPAYKEMVVFHADFDAQKDVVRDLGAQTQSTLIAYDGGTETDRSVGDTDPQSIGSLFASTLGR